MILESTYFSFNNVIYRQNFGTPMGSPSLLIADLVLRDIESRAINILNIPLPIIYARYIDDILLAAPSDSINDI